VIECLLPFLFDSQPVTLFLVAVNFSLIFAYSVSGWHWVYSPFF
jgi:hypothetical protein